MLKPIVIWCILLAAIECLGQGPTYRGTFIGNGSGLTNVTAVYVSATNSVAAGLVPIGKGDYQTNASFSFTGISGVNLTNYCSGVLHVTNSLNALISITAATPWHIQGTWNCTNVSTISVEVVPNRWTNAICYPEW